MIMLRQAAPRQLSSEVMLREHFLFFFLLNGFGRVVSTRVYTKLMMIVFETYVIDFHWQFGFVDFFSAFTWCAPFNADEGRWQRKECFVLSGCHHRLRTMCM